MNVFSSTLKNCSVFCLLYAYVHLHWEKNLCIKVLDSSKNSRIDDCGDFLETIYLFLLPDDKHLLNNVHT